MIGTERKCAWQRIAAISLVVITMGMVLRPVVDMQIFYKTFGRSAAFIESLRSTRPEGVGARWTNYVKFANSSMIGVP